MQPLKTLSGLTALLVLAACNPEVPESGARGAGFDSPEQVAQRREAQLRGDAPLRPSATILPPAPGTTVAGAAPLPAGQAPQSEAEELASATRAALGRPAATTQAAPAATPAAPAPLPATPAPAAPAQAPADLNLDRDNPAISREQDFGAVSAERDIQADAERLRAARQQYQLVTPTELQRPDSTGPNIFAYALGPAKPKGTQGAFRRGLGASESRAATRCQNYRSDDIAQEDFLASGGPERDRLGIDPDGDGNACNWDPAVVRRLVQSQ
ncbi:hypothetical protein [Jannaschia marina]|uniref:hypothetical protein n=1 Tax=Jannaschia marina TaxID=2741674 RepID=UPI0015C8D294|nr:hypothetical protein [Jannaschia marina]